MKSHDIREMERSAQLTALNIIAQECVQTAKEREKTQIWAVRVLYANCCDVSEESDCWDRVERYWSNSQWLEKLGSQGEHC